jgi:Domain of Unknown Function (DUF1080)/PA14 domain
VLKPTVMRKIFYSTPLFFVFTISIFAQSPKGFVSVELKDLSAFKPQDGNWRVVGDVSIDRNTDIHDKILAAPPAPTKKGKKPPVSDPIYALAQPVSFKEGTGILLNMNDDKKKSHLLTNFEHGDIELELELMVPKGSNSGIYLQGRYEVQILDSWGVKNPSYGDLGGIYRNWETKPGEIYMGKAPLSNPAKAPGLWQKFKIIFQAPRFDTGGKKISNAKFISVELNGIKIHDNLEVPLPTGGPIDKTETAKGPLMIQGDHGPVAFRNIRYKLLREIKPSISSINYKVYHGHFKVINDFINQKPLLAGSSPTLTCEVLDIEDAYGSVYSGTISIPEDGSYEFGLVYTGGARLTVDGKQLIERQRNDAWPLDIGWQELKAGSYPFEIINYKDAGWMPPRLGFFVRPEGAKEVALHAYNSYPPDENPTSSIFLNPTQGPRLLRAFVDFKGDRNRRLTHTIGVGEPGGINYVYDLKSGALACVWRGGFVDATPMWHDRGDGSFRPIGAAEFTFYNQPLAYLKNELDPFPVLSNDDEYKGKGYEIDEATGRPVFKYFYKGLEVTSKVTPDAANKFFDHEIILKERGTEPKLFYKLGEGKIITPLPDGSFAIDDKRYYIKVHSGVTIVRQIGDLQELVASFDSASLKYSIIW